MYERIIMAYDGSVNSQMAILSIKDLSYWKHSILTLVAVIPALSIDLPVVEMGYLGDPNSTTWAESIREQLRKGVKKLRLMGHEANGEILIGEVIPEISNYAEQQGADLIVIGHKHEKNRLRRWWSGSNAKLLVEKAPCNVLIVVHKDQDYS